MRRHLIILLACCLCSMVHAAEPRLNFSDVDSGPATGNGDTSLGQTAGVNGAIVTVWGTNLGSSQGTSTVSLNGAPAAKVYYWGNAVAPYSPANLSLRQGMQVVIFQVSHLAAAGSGLITLTVDGTITNGLPFTVRTGAIRFVKTSGNDTAGNGSWANPWRTMVKAVASLASGDIAYVGDGVNQTASDKFDAAPNLGSDGASGRPQALIAYPGATCNIGNATDIRGIGAWVVSTGDKAKYWTVAKLNLTGQTLASDTNSGWRLVGCRITTPQADSMSGAVSVIGNHVVVFGNEFTQCGKPFCNKMTHPLYMSGKRQDTGARAPTESDREAAWNYFHDNNANRAINVYSEQATSAFITNHRIHHNWIENQVGDALLLGYYVTGENWIYDNVIVNAGTGPEPTAGSTSHAGLHIAAGHESATGTVVHVYNNTIYSCGFSGATWPDTSGALYVTDRSRYAFEFRNNIVVSTGQAYKAPGSDAGPTSTDHNLWFGKGAAPSEDTHALNVDAKFIDAAGKNFRLSSVSPAIDQGVACPFASTDFTDQPRLQGSATDLGAFEYHPTSGDVTPPTISSVSASSITRTSAAISWTTNEAANGQIEYGLTTTYGNSSTLATAMTTAHSISMASLSAGTTYHYRIKSSDATGNQAVSVDKTFTTTVNSTPVATAQSVTTAEHTAKVITLAGTDADGDGLTYAMVTNPVHGTLSGTGANRTYTPAAGYTGTDSFTFTVTDGSATSSAATVSITVTALVTVPVTVPPDTGATDGGGSSNCGAGAGLIIGLSLVMMTLRRRR